MNSKLIVIIALSYLYGFFELLMNRRQRKIRKQKIVRSGDKASIWLLSGLIGIGYLLSFSIGATRIGRIYHWDTFFTINDYSGIFRIHLPDKY
jgi:hypothetical protein